MQLVHLQCAAYEVPLTSGDQKWFGVSMIDICEKNLTKDRDGWRVFQTLLHFLIILIIEAGIIRTPNICPSLLHMCPFVSWLDYFLEGFRKSCKISGGARQELYMVLEMNGPQLQSANMLEEVEFYRALFELYEGGVVCPNT